MPIAVRWDVARAIRLYRDGWILRQISSDVGVAVSAVRTQLRNAGVELRPAVHPARPDIDTAQIMRLRDDECLSWARWLSELE